MGLCYLLVCRDCRQTATIGKNSVIWMEDPDTLKLIEHFLERHENHSLVYCNWNRFDDMAPIEDDVKWTSVTWKDGFWCESVQGYPTERFKKDEYGYWQKAD